MCEKVGKRRQEGQVRDRWPRPCVPYWGAQAICHEGVKKPELERHVTRIAFQGSWVRGGGVAPGELGGTGPARAAGAAIQRRGHVGEDGEKPGWFQRQVEGTAQNCTIAQSAGNERQGGSKQR